MSNSDEVLWKASQILDKHRIGESASQAFNNAYKFWSTSEVAFTSGERNPGRFGHLEKWVRVRAKGQDLILGCTTFHKSSWDGGIAPPSYEADAYVYTIEGDLVLHTVAHEFGGVIKVSTDPDSIKQLKAGPGLQVLGWSIEKLVEHSDKSDRARAKAEVDERASNIDLGEYE